MALPPNALRWNRQPGHYEVYYLTLTDPISGVGAWIRYTMVAPVHGSEPATASLWFLTMEPRVGVFGRKASFPIEELGETADPFELRIATATLTDASMAGQFEDVSWDLRWAPTERAYETVHAALRPVASTILVLPHAAIEVDGHIGYGGRRLELAGARGGQAHLWGSKHASSWAWAHCNDFVTDRGEPADDVFVDGVSVFVSRFGREVGPNTPVVGRIDGQDFRSTSPLRVLRNSSTFELQSWRFEAVGGDRRLVGEVNAERDQLAGVTYHDPDGELAYCYNSETASMGLELYERSGRLGQWRHSRTLRADGRAHFEYAQRSPIPDIELLTQ
jgi:hypothetical protein